MAYCPFFISLKLENSVNYFVRISPMQNTVPLNQEKKRTHCVES